MAQAAVNERGSPQSGHAPEGSALLTPEEVAAQLRVTRRTVYAWLKIGRLRGLRAGKGWRIRAQDLEAFLMPPAAWEQRLDESLSLVRSQVPADIPEEEIMADLEAAREASHQERCARGH